MKNLNNIYKFNIALILVFPILFSSCSSFQAVSKNSRKLEYDALQVTPTWKKKKDRGKQAIAPLVGIGIGVVYGSNTELTFRDETIAKENSAAIFGIGGLILGSVVNKFLFTKKKKSFRPEQSQDWLISFNKTSPVEYLIKDQKASNTLILVPKIKVDLIKKEFALLVSDLQLTKPRTTLVEIQNWEKKLDLEYSIVPKNQIKGIRTNLKHYEQKLAGIQLLEEARNSFPVNYNSLKTLTNFRINNYKLLQLASRDTSHQAEQIVQQKLETMLSKLVNKIYEELAILDSNTSVYQINNLANKIFDRFQYLMDRTEVKSLIRAVKEKKTDIVSSISHLKTTIKSTSSLARLSEIKELYLDNTVSNHYILSLYQIYEKRQLELSNQEKTRIDQENRRKKQEEELQLAKEQEELKRKLFEVTLSGEPTEWQMQFAIEYQYNLKNKEIEDISKLNFENGNAIEGLMGILGKIAMQGQVYVSSFEKYNCVEANGKPGFVCDYAEQIQLKQNPYSIPYNQFSNQVIKTARFSKVKDIWVVMEYIN